MKYKTLIDSLPVILVSLQALMFFGVKQSTKKAVDYVLNEQLAAFKADYNLYQLVYPEKLKSLKHLQKIIMDATPEPTHPDMEWEDIVDDLARDIDFLKNDLSKYLEEYGYVLSDTVLQNINEAYHSCRLVKWAKDYPDFDGDINIEEARRCVNAVYTILDRGLQLLKEELKVDKPKTIIAKVKDSTNPFRKFLDSVKVKFNKNKLA